MDYQETYQGIDDSLPVKIRKLKKEFYLEFQKRLSILMGEEVPLFRAIWTICCFPYGAPKPKPEPLGQIYFIKSKNLVKIGFSQDLKNRCATLKTMSPISPQLIYTLKGSVDKEKEIHRRFNHLRHHGEWFRYTDEIRNYIDSMRESENA